MNSKMIIWIFAFAMVLVSANAANNLEIYRIQPMTVENDHNMKIGVVVYNPNSFNVTISNVKDIWSIDKVIKDQSKIKACSPSCTANGAEESVTWDGTHTIGAGNYSIFTYTVDLDNPGNGIYADVNFSNNDTPYLVQNVYIKDHAATAYLAISIDASNFYEGIGPINGSINQTFTAKIEETGNDKKIKADNQYVIIDIPSSWTSLGTIDGNVIINGNTIIYDIPSDLKNIYQIFSFYAAAPQLTDGWLFNGTLNGTDEDGFVHNDMFELLVLTTDITPPSWNQTPQNQTIEYGTLFNYDVNATDASGIDSYFINDTTNFAVNSSNGLITNNTQLSIGDYDLNISVNDTEGNVNSSVITVIVQDTTAPSWNPLPSNRTLEYGDDLSYDANATDLQTITYSVNDTTDFAINSANGLITNNTLLAVGIYNLQVNATDASSNTNSTTITITVQDTTPPAWSPLPSNQTSEYGSPFSYEVDATDLQTITYSVNDTTDFAINSANGLITNNTLLSVGTYDLEINATDTSNNINSTVITVLVEDTTAPTWNQTPQDQNINDGDNFSYQVAAHDLSNVDTYFINDTVNFAINSSSGLITNNTDLQVGEYDLNISVNDTYGNVLSKVIDIQVSDAGYPIWNPVPEDQTAGYGYQFSYDINATDDVGIDSYFINDTTNFIIYQNGTMATIANNTFLSLGPYNLNLSVNDTSNNINSIDITITVLDITSPSWNTLPSDQIVEYGSPFSYGADNATDDIAIDSYFINDTTNFDINSTTALITNNTLLSLGNYSLNISINDTAGNINSTIIIVTVQDTTIPAWSPLPSDQVFRYGENFSYDANATDLQIITYSINDTVNFSINSVTGVIINNTLLSLGNYSLQINATDASNNTNSTTIIATIQEADPPIISSTAPSSGESLSSGTTFYLMQLITDEQAICRFSTSNTTWSSMAELTTTNSTTHTQMITGLSDGNTYNYYFLCEDTQTLPNRMSSSYHLQFSVSSPTPSQPPSSGGTSGGTAGGGYFVEPCDENWVCSGWSECVGGARERSCEDINECGTEDDKPTEIENCVISEKPETNIFWDPKLEKISTRIPEDEIIYFYHDDILYSLSIMEVSYDDVVKFRISPGDITFTIETLETLEIDLDGDGSSDISITLRKIKDRDIYVIIKSVEKPAQEIPSKIVGKAITIRSQTSSSALHATPILLIILITILLISIRRSKLPPKLKTILTLVNVSLIFVIFILFFIYPHTTGVTASSVKDIGIGKLGKEQLSNIRIFVGFVLMILIFAIMIRKYGKGKIPRITKSCSGIKNRIMKVAEIRKNWKKEKGAVLWEAGKDDNTLFNSVNKQQKIKKNNMINQIKEVYKNEH